MKRIIVFVGLKIGEIVGAIFVPLIVGWAIYPEPEFIYFKLTMDCAVVWAIGLFCCAVILGLFVTVKPWVLYNWRKAGKIAARWCVVLCCVLMPVSVWAEQHRLLNYGATGTIIVKQTFSTIPITRDFLTPCIIENNQKEEVIEYEVLSIKEVAGGYVINDKVLRVDVFAPKFWGVVQSQVIAILERVCKEAR